MKGNINKNHVNDILKFTQKVIEKCGPRLAGSQESKQAAIMIRDELKKHCEKAEVEEFDVHPGAFLGFIKTTVISYAVSSILLFFGHLFLAAAGYFFGVFMGVCQFVFYLETFDPLYKKMTGYNVSASLEPRGDVRQQIIISGHHDSAYEFRFIDKNPTLYPIRVLAAFLSHFAVFIMIMIWIASIIITGSAPFFAYAMKYAVFALLIFVLPMYFFLGKDGVPGAGDNMIASAIVIKLAEIFKKTKKKSSLKHTRLIFLSVDAEEAGLRGSRAYVKKHKQQLMELPSYNLNFECIFKADELKFFSTDINSTVKLSKEMALQCSEIAQKAGYPAKVIPLPPGGGATDAAEFAKIGVNATTLMEMTTDFKKGDIVYHTKRDKIESIEPEAVKTALDIAFRYIIEKDQEVK